MDEEVELAPMLRNAVEDGVEAGVIGDVAMAGDMRAKLLRQRLDALAEGVALVGQGQFRALVGAGLGDAPGDRTVVRHAKDQAFLAGHQAVTNRHMRLLRIETARPAVSHRHMAPSSGHAR